MWNIYSGLFLIHEKLPLKLWDYTIRHWKNGPWSIIHQVKSARDRGRQNNMISLTGKILKIYKRNSFKTQSTCWEFSHNQSQKSNNKWAGIKSEVPNNTHTEVRICNDNPPSRITALSWQRDLQNHWSCEPCHPTWTGHTGELWQHVIHWRRERQTTPVHLPWETQYLLLKHLEDAMEFQ